MPATMPAIPERQPPGDTFSGAVIKVDETPLLALAPLADAALTASGDFVIRYGIRFVGKLHLSIVPGLVVLDYGDMLTGNEAWEFLLKRSHLHPRAEVFGYRNDGRDDMQLVRNLDMAVPVEVLVYADAAAVEPLARPAALIAPDEAEVPTRLLQYLPRYRGLAEWRGEV